MSMEVQCPDVSVETRRTTDCEKSFACLEGKRDLCKVKFRLGGPGEEVLFVSCLHPGYCSHQVRFGVDGYLCGCAVRKEIYRKYHL